MRGNQVKREERRQLIRDEMATLEHPERLGRLPHDEEIEKLSEYSPNKLKKLLVLIKSDRPYHEFLERWNHLLGVENIHGGALEEDI